LFLALLFVMSMAKKDSKQRVLHNVGRSGGKKLSEKKENIKKKYYNQNLNGIDQIFDDESDVFVGNDGNGNPPPAPPGPVHNGFGNNGGPHNQDPPSPPIQNQGPVLNGFDQAPPLDFLDDEDDHSGDITTDPEFLGVIDPTFNAGPKLPNTTDFVNLNTQFQKLFPCISLFVEKGLTSVYASQQGELFLSYINNGTTVPHCNELTNSEANSNYAEGYRITIILQDGNIIYDSYYLRNTSAIPDNQNTNPEIFDAILNRNEGFATRISPITGLKTIYIAKVFFKKHDRTQFITVRASYGLAK